MHLTPSRRQHRRLRAQSSALLSAACAAALLLGAAAAGSAFLPLARPGAAQRRAPEQRRIAASLAAAAASLSPLASGARELEQSAVPPPPWAVLPAPAQFGLFGALILFVVGVVPTWFGMGFFGMPRETPEDVEAYERAMAAKRERQEALAKAEAKKPRKSGVTFGEFETLTADELTVGQRVLVRDSNEDWIPGVVTSLSPDIRVRAGKAQLNLTYRFIKAAPPE